LTFCQDPKDIFSSITPEPVAAASLGQAWINFFASSLQDLAQMIRFTVADCEVMELKSRLRLGETAR